MPEESWNFRPIGYLRTPFEDKFGIPRQPKLAMEVRGEIHLLNWVGGLETLRGLEGFSHLWVLWVFHTVKERKTMVRPPRLKGKVKIGIFASRSPHRPNPIGISVMKILGFKQTHKGIIIEVAGVDMLDGTPVLDIKPYVPYVDVVPEATGGWATEPVTMHDVQFTAEAEVGLEIHPELRAMITEVLGQDPRPNSHHNLSTPAYVMILAGTEVHWKIREEGVLVDYVGERLPFEKRHAVTTKLDEP